MEGVLFIWGDTLDSITQDNLEARKACIHEVEARLDNKWGP